MRLVSRIVRLGVGFLVAAMIVTCTGFIASGTAAAAVNCVNPVFGDEFYMTIVYRNGTYTFCSFPHDRPEWMDTLRTEVVRGAQQTEVSAVQAEDDLPNGNLYVNARFHGSGATNYVTTEVSGNGGPKGWVSATKVYCNQPFNPTAPGGNEGRELADFFYHLGEVVKTNSQGYSGQPIAATELGAPGGHVSYYAPHCKV